MAFAVLLDLFPVRCVAKMVAYLEDMRPLSRLADKKNLRAVQANFIMLDTLNMAGRLTGTSNPPFQTSAS